MKAGWRTEGILGPGNHLPQLINPMKHFYWILRITHGGGEHGQRHGPRARAHAG